MKNHSSYKPNFAPIWWILTNIKSNMASTCPLVIDDLNSINFELPSGTQVELQSASSQPTHVVQI